MTLNYCYCIEKNVLTTRNTTSPSIRMVPLVVIKFERFKNRLTPVETNKPINLTLAWFIMDID
jgi:hypothetical protein